MAEYNPIKAKEPKAHCECKVGWGGDYCEIEVGCGASARDDPCGTNGRCTTDALEHYACQCELGFEGKELQSPVWMINCDLIDTRLPLLI